MARGLAEFLRRPTVTWSLSPKKEMNLAFWKVESMGNDFPLIHLDAIDERLLPELAIILAERHFSIGGDGLLAVGPMPGRNMRLRMFNPDGSEDFCGNGLRCAAMHGKNQSWVDQKFTIEHRGNLVPCEIDAETIITEIGKASYKAEDVPVRFRSRPDLTFQRPAIYSGTEGRLTGSALTTGSTHTVMQPLPGNRLPDDEVFRNVSSKLENDPQFLIRTSVIWRRQVTNGVIQIRIWERGAGETIGCGTGSAAAAIEYFRENDRGGTVEVRNPGGIVWVSVDNWESVISVRGHAAELYRGSINLEDRFNPNTLGKASNLISV